MFDQRVSAHASPPNPLTSFPLSHAHIQEANASRGKKIGGHSSRLRNERGRAYARRDVCCVRFLLASNRACVRILRDASACALIGVCAGGMHARDFLIHLA